ncbi:tyrosine-type recombinase/integrase [Spiribacter insolitus]|uniref:Tyrosine-type recombinase/integrase n=1 Tax=Spiribacter insolitus TaxID=3122417 RepID=A0ABV3T3L7_9GAMM
MPVLDLNHAVLRRIDRYRPETRAVSLFDRTLKGFMLELRSTGTGTWYYRYRDQGRRIRLLRLGRLGELSVTKARQAARRFDALVEAGENPRESLSPAQRSVTFREFVETRYFPHVELHNRSWPSTRSQVTRHLMPRFGDRRLDAIRRADILAMQHETRLAGMAVGTCNRLLIHMRTIFNAAIRWELLPEDCNPTKGVKALPGAVSRERFLDAVEVRRLFDALDRSRSPQLARVVRMLLYTGARKREILDARWEQVDFEHRLLTVPRSKSGKVRYIALSDAALEILRATPRQPGVPWVFPNPRTKKPIVSIHYGWDRVRREVGMPDLRIHDLRHSFASFLVNAGHSLYEVQALLGHQSPKMTMRYAHLAPATLLTAANSLAGELSKKPY